MDDGTFPPTLFVIGRIAQGPGLRPIRAADTPACFAPSLERAIQAIGSSLA
jgi:hypothetical protein